MPFRLESSLRRRSPNFVRKDCKTRLRQVVAFPGRNLDGAVLDPACTAQRGISPGKAMCAGARISEGRTPDHGRHLFGACSATVCQSRLSGCATSEPHGLRHKSARTRPHLRGFLPRAPPGPIRGRRPTWRLHVGRQPAQLPGVCLAYRHARVRRLPSAEAWPHLRAPAAGRHGVTIYINDRTQGPACSLAAGAATVVRNYLVLQTK